MTLEKHFIDWAAELVKAGHKFVYVLDNIDWEEKTHEMRQESQNKSVHAVATSIVFDRVHDEGITDSGPQQDLKLCNVHGPVNMNDADFGVVRSRYRVILAQLVFKHFTAFEMFRQYTPESMECSHATEMKMMSEVVTMPVLMKDKKVWRSCRCFGSARKNGLMKYIMLLDFVHLTLVKMMIPQP